MTPANCQSCRAAIVWAKTASGKIAPFEVDVGGVWVIDSGSARYVGAGANGPQRVLELDVPRVRYTSHFAKCPDAAAWRHGHGA